MASTILVSVGSNGLTLTANLYTLTSDTAIESAMSGTEKTNAKGWYTFPNTGTETGWHRIQILNGATTIGTLFVYLTNGTNTEDLCYESIVLIPTTLGRTLDVSAGGEAGIDWANVGSPTTAVNLSGTTLGALSTTERDALAAAYLDLANAIETGLTPRGAMRLVAAALAGKLSGALTPTVTIRNAVQDSKARITATVDGDGNRTAITTDVT